METTFLAIPWGYKEATILIHSFFPSRPERTCEFEENEHGFVRVLHVHYCIEHSVCGIRGQTTISG